MNMNRIYYNIASNSVLNLFEDELCAKVDSKINNSYSRDFELNSSIGFIEYEGEAKFPNLYTKEAYIEKLKSDSKAVMYKGIWQDAIDLLEGREIVNAEWKALLLRD